MFIHVYTYTPSGHAPLSVHSLQCFEVTQLREEHAWLVFKPVHP